MRKMIVTCAGAAALFAATAFAPPLAQAMTIAAPAGLAKAAQAANLTEDVAYVCRRGWRWRQCWWTPGYAYYRPYYYPPAYRAYAYRPYYYRPYAFYRPYYPPYAYYRPYYRPVFAAYAVLPPCVLPAISPLVGMALSARVVVTARQPELRQAGLKPALPLPHLVVRFRSSPVLGSRSGANFGILGPLATL